MMRLTSGTGPGVQLVYTKNERHKEHQHKRQQTCACLQHPPNHQTPSTVYQVVQHQDGQAAQHHTQPEHVGHEIRAEKLCRIYKVTHHTESCCYHANE